MNYITTYCMRTIDVFVHVSISFSVSFFLTKNLTRVALAFTTKENYIM